MDKMLWERGLEELSLTSADGKTTLTGKDLTEMMGKLYKYNHARQYPGLARLPQDLLTHLVEQNITSNRLDTLDGAETLLASLQKAFKDYAYKASQDKGTERVQLSITEEATTPLGDKVTKRSALTSELLDTLEYQNLLKLYGDVAPFLPELHKDGLEVTDGKDKVIKLGHYQELVALVEQRGKKGITVQRFKGLGEMMPQQLWETTMNPETRTLLQVAIEDAASADRMFDVLMGDQVAPRRNFIETHAQSVSNLDI
ncbi:MAG: hypothetical protein KC475_07590 [Cyanobacteria bacterium HKST-UBA03]|nr:hypothetical protein [Cyanobacteria bacterium HKST-UBA03]